MTQSGNNQETNMPLEKNGDVTCFELLVVVVRGILVMDFADPRAPSITIFRGELGRFWSPLVWGDCLRQEHLESRSS